MLEREHGAPHGAPSSVFAALRIEETMKESLRR
ncbi:MAG: hypothetical protein RLZZ387_907 [Chloroflexota bacterium]|jgi:hypothetical protein